MSSRAILLSVDQCVRREEQTRDPQPVRLVLA